MSGRQNNDSANKTRRQLEEAPRLLSTRNKSRAQLPAPPTTSVRTQMHPDPFDRTKKARGMVKKRVSLCHSPRVPQQLKVWFYSVLEGLGAESTPACDPNSASPAASFQSLANRNPHIISHDRTICPKAASIYRQPNHYTPLAGKKKKKHFYLVQLPSNRWDIFATQAAWIL